MSLVSFLLFRWYTDEIIRDAVRKPGEIMWKFNIPTYISRDPIRGLLAEWPCEPKVWNGMKN
jgi:hypothetical protein